MSDFTWIPLYKEIAQKLLEFENRQSELIELLNQIRDKGLPIFVLTDKDSDGNSFPLENIDPFTFYSCFNRKLTDQNRKDILKEIKTLWNLSSDVPSDFSGIPLMNNQQAWFFSYKSHRKSEDIPILWKLFKEAIGSGITEFTFNDVLQIRTVKYNITMGLFWIAPEKYLNLDSVNRTYLQHKFAITVKNLNYQTYNSILQEINTNSNIPFNELSLEAWKSKSQKVTKYWVLNAYKENLLGKCLHDNTWMMQYQYGRQDTGMVTSNWRVASQVKDGDFVLLYCFDNTYYAWGIASKPKLAPDQTETVEDIVDSKKHEFSNGITCFEDAECFYENLSDIPNGYNECWGQRIDVNCWNDIVNKGVVVNGVASVRKGHPRTAIFEIDESFFSNVKNQLSIGKELIIKTNVKTTPQNLILYGAPGTGKTFEAKRIAVELATQGVCSRKADSVGRKQILNTYKHLVNEQRIEMITFHQSYSYEDFIEGIRPLEQEGIKYKVQDGVFKDISIRATGKPSEQFVLIIDEINRGNIAQIFGELITLIEIDKRSGLEEEVTIRLPYSKKLFSVPANLHILGTMNTADRSVESLDTALRRRFSFWEMMPDYETIPLEIDGIQLRRMLKAINDRIFILKDSDHAIGHAYFYNVKSLSDLVTVFSTKVIPLLQEYFFNKHEAIQNVIGAPFVKAVENITALCFDSSDYEDKVLYSITDEHTWTANDFKNIYEQKGA